MSPASVPEPLLDHPSIEHWIGFSDDGTVEIRSGRVELGQGNATALTQIAADELDVSAQQTRLVAGDTRSAPNEGFTTGSRSIAVGGMALRMAASAARHVLLVEAAKLLQAETADLSVENGQILRAGAPTGLTWWALAKTVDLACPVLDHAQPKAASQRHLSGQSLARIDLPEKLAGSGFIHDLVFENMCHGRVLHPPSRRARIEDVDIAALEARDGIEAVVRNGAFLGVIAKREEQALAALKTAERTTTWSSGHPAPADPVASLYEVGEPAQVTHETGDITSASGQRFETQVARPYVAHASIGPACAIAQWEADDHLTVWTHSQGVYPLQGALATALKIDAKRIDVIHSPGAGCYGHNGADDAALDAALLARAVPGVPVRLLWSRADELASSPVGTGAVTKAVAVVNDAGRIEAFCVDITCQPFGQRPGRGGNPNMLAAEYIDGAPPIPVAGDGTNSAERNALPYYAIPHMRTSKTIVQSLPYRTSSIRGLGAFINVFAIETLMDDMADELKHDAVDFRLEHLDDPRAQAVIRRVAELANWPGKRGEGIGTGIAFARYKNTGAYCAVAARVDSDPDIRVTNLWAVCDGGEAINPDGILHQIEGGMIQAMSWTLKEEVRFEGEAIVSKDWENYPILKFSEIPETTVELIAHPEAPPLGVAEAAQGPTAAAIGNAVFRALGVRVRRLPLTRSAIMAAFES